MNISELICARRMQLRLTLTEVSKRSGLSIPFLSQLEKGDKGLSVSSLKRIADALEVSMNYFLDTQDEDEYVHSVDNLHYFGINGSKVRYSRLGSTKKERELEPLYVVVPPGHESEISKHAGEEFFYILKGSITFIVGKKEYQLSSGNTIHYKSTTRHGWKNIGTEEVHLISVNSMSLF
jgi:quercetin dioxygenase-like cupin family protein/DNA-binding Xre family transcriptional regulator